MSDGTLDEFDHWSDEQVRMELAVSLFGYGWQRCPSSGIVADRQGQLLPPDTTWRGWESCPTPFPISELNLIRVPYFNRIDEAWLLVEHFRQQDMPVMVGVAMDLKGKARGYYALVGDADGGHRAEAETAPLAICRAALAAVRAAKGERR